MIYVLVIALLAGLGVDIKPLVLTAQPRVGMEPQDVHIRARVEPNAANRILRLSLASAGFFRATEVQLDGADARPTTDLWWKTVPGGEYEVLAQVARNDGTVLVERSAITIKPRFEH